MSDAHRAIRNNYNHLLRSLLWLIGACIFLLGTSARAQRSSSVEVVCPQPAWQLADSVELRIPGNSRLAGLTRGPESVHQRLLTIATLLRDGAPIFDAFVNDSGQRVYLLHAARATTKDARLQVVVVPTLDSAGAVRAIDVFVDDLREFDQRFPTDDGVQRASMATLRNIDAVRKHHTASGNARFVAGNRDQVVVGLRAAPNGSSTAQLLLYRYESSGRLVQTVAYHVVR